MTKIVLVGRGGSGKNYMAETLIKRGLKLQVSMTTRPMRPGEVDGKDYYFLTEEEFQSRLEKGLVKEWKQFNGWKYGTLYSEWNDKDIFIYTPSGIRDMAKADRKRCLIIYLDIPRIVIHQRLMERGDTNDSVERRLASDDKDFEGFTDYDVRITNPDF